jgi:hypothetical protein
LRAHDDGGGSDGKEKLGEHFFLEGRFWGRKKIEEVGESF